MNPFGFDRPVRGEYHRSMSAKRRMRVRQAILCVPAVVLYLGFVVAEALPGIVFCHRSGGRVAVEIAGPTGACSCDECEHCRERLAKGRPGARSDGPVLEPCHCTHEPILIAADRSALRRDDSFPTPGKARAGSLSPAAAADFGPMDSAAAAWISPPVFPSFSGETRALRC